MGSNTLHLPDRIRGRRLQAIRQRWFHRYPLCVTCKAKGLTVVATELDHIIPLERGGPDVDANRQGLCHDCHALKTTREAGRRVEVRPQLPRPGCRVRLVCGPPGAGKSTYVRQHKGPDDLVIDHDDIARELGFGRIRPPESVIAILTERNRRLAALALEPPQRTAWVILGAPSMKLRVWWCDTLNVQPGDLEVLVPDVTELRRRIWADAERTPGRDMYLRIISRWMKLERSNDPGLIQRGVGPDGYPLDPLHHWHDIAPCFT